MERHPAGRRGREHLELEASKDTGGFLFTEQMWPARLTDHNQRGSPLPEAGHRHHRTLMPRRQGQRTARHAPRTLHGVHLETVTSIIAIREHPKDSPILQVPPSVAGRAVPGEGCDPRACPQTGQEGIDPRIATGKSDGGSFHQEAATGSFREQRIPVGVNGREYRRTGERQHGPRIDKPHPAQIPVMPAVEPEAEQELLSTGAVSRTHHPSAGSDGRHDQAQVAGHRPPAAGIAPPGHIAGACGQQPSATCAKIAGEQSCQPPGASAARRSSSKQVAGHGTSWCIPATSYQPVWMARLWP
jgi:hypothetical protein